MEGAGVIAFAVLLALLPLSMWAERVERFRRLSPHEQNLQRASHGIALPVVIAAAAALFLGPSAPQDFVAALVRDPASMWPPAVLLGGLFAYCFVRARAGMQRVVGDPDGLLIPRARVKFIGGAAGLFWLWPAGTGLARGLLLLSLWCAVTGAVRYLLLIRRPSSAAAMVQASIDANEFEWEPQRRRR